MSVFHRRLPLCALVLAALAVLEATAVGTSAAPLVPPVARFEEASFAPLGSVTTSPYGWQHFCAAQPRECAPAQLGPVSVRLTLQSWTELNQINSIVNRAIYPISDEDHYRIYEQGILNWWTYPDDGKGNCNDYVLMKRRLLIEAGWPKAALLMTVVTEQHGAGHLILTVHTDHGDLILDNMRDDVIPWDQTGYRFVKRQSQLEPNDWIAIAVPSGPEGASVRDSR